MRFTAFKRASFVVIIPIALSAYTHIWNASGFPDIFYDEGVYLRRAMNVLYHLEVQESRTYYDHPYLGQIMLAAYFAMSGFPGSLNPTATVSSIEMIHLSPRIFVGLLAMLDTFLIYKITERRYDSRNAVLASLLFAVMPITWITRRVLLDTLLLPLMLSSIYLALRLSPRDPCRMHHVLLVLSGFALGLAIFTKMPAIAAVPIVAYLVYRGSGRKKLKNMVWWVIPVLIIPILWPLHSVVEGRFDFWLGSMVSQTQRSSEGISTIFSFLWATDPILLLLGSAGMIYSILIRRDVFPLLWAVPFLLLYSAVSYVQYFHVIPIIPILCISSALVFVDLIRRIQIRRAEWIVSGAMIALGTFGLLATTALITTNMTSSQFEAAAFVLWVGGEETTIVASPAYSWVYNFVLHMPYALGDYREALYSPILGNEVILVSDPHFRSSVGDEPILQHLQNYTSSIRVFQGQVQNYDTTSYPYTSLSTTRQGELVDIRQYPKP